ncbi:MAG: DUF3775 domain-containing protein [Rhizobiales bacterium]|nr:DUF3775 domain-containing protein [Hyphomicrobiales bacterium]
MLDIAPEKIAHVIVRAREVDAKVASWDQEGDEATSDSILEARSGDATEAELKAFIAGLNIDERISLVALTWIGRGTYEADELEEAKATAMAENVTPTESYLLGIPLLADYLEEGLDRLGISVEDAESGIL